ncbi:hypothetical protein Peur_011130 [Populus x canadensis]
MAATTTENCETKPVNPISTPPFVETISRLTLIHDPSTVHADAGKLKMCKMLLARTYPFTVQRQRKGKTSASNFITYWHDQCLLHYCTQLRWRASSSSSSFFLFIT